MATCFKYQTVWVPFTNDTTPRNQLSILVPDLVTPVNTCNLLLVNASEYAQLSHGFITSAEDAQTISFSFVLLLAVGFGIKAIRSALDTYDNSIDEKH